MAVEHCMEWVSLLWLRKRSKVEKGYHIDVHSFETSYGVINCSVFRKFIYFSFRDLLIFTIWNVLLIFTIWNLYVWTAIFLLITMIYFILVVYKKLAKKLGKEYLKSEKITKFRKIFYVVITYGILKLTKVFIILNLWINNIIYQDYIIIYSEI